MAGKSARLGIQTDVILKKWVCAVSIVIDTDPWIGYEG